MKIYVGNLPFDANEENVRQAFEEFGETNEVSLITDKYTGKSRGFAFVEMSDDGAANEAIAALNGREFNGRTLTVSEARPRQEGGGGRGGGGGRRGGGGGGGYRDNRRRSY